MSKKVLEIINLSVEFENKLILDNINLEIQEREFLGIIGPNGGGKTTLLKAILGLYKLKSGKIKIFEEDFPKNLDLVGYVPQSTIFEKNYPISVFDVVLMGRLKNTYHTKFTKFDYQLAEDSLSKVDMIDKRKRLISNLSGGEKQRVLIARAISSQPKILLLDEPTANIDIKSSKGFYDLLEVLNKEISIVLVSHDIGAVSNYVKKIACLNINLIFHNTKQITPDMIAQTYNCPIDLIAHGTPHRVFEEHS